MSADPTPVPTPAPVPAPSADEPLDSTLGILFSSLDDPKDPKPADPAAPVPAPAPVPPAAKPAPGDPPAPPAEPDGKIKVRRKKPEPTPVPAAPAPTPVPAPTPAPAANKEEEEFEAGLLEEEREQIEYARDAERLMPDKFKGQEAKVKKFLKEHQAYLDKAKAADPEVQFDANNTEYQAWLAKNNPVLSPKQVREIERQRAVEEADKRTDSKLGEVREEMFRREEEPKVKAETQKFFGELAEELPDDLKTVLREKGVEEARKLFPIELRVANLVMSECSQSMEEFLAITRNNPVTGKPLKAYDPKNERHVKLLEFINVQCDMFKKGGGDLRVRDGKTFVTRAEYFGLKPEQRQQYWTFSNADIMAMSKVAAKEAIRTRVEAEYKQRENEGWARPSKAPAAAPTPPPAGAPPAPRATPIPAAPPTADADRPDPNIDLLMGKAV